MPHRRHPHKAWEGFFARQRDLAAAEGESSWSDSPTRLAAAAGAALRIHCKRPAGDTRPYSVLLPPGPAEHERAVRREQAAATREEGDSQGVHSALAEPQPAQPGQAASSSSGVQGTATPGSATAGGPSCLTGNSLGEPSPRRIRYGRKRGRGKCRGRHRAAAAEAAAADRPTGLPQAGAGARSSESREPSSEHGLPTVASAPTSPAVPRRRRSRSARRWQ